MTKEEFEAKFKGKLVTVSSDFDVPKEYWNCTFKCLGATEKSGLAKIVLAGKEDTTIYTCVYNKVRRLDDNDSR